MRPLLTLRKKYFLACGLFLITAASNAQICQNPTDTVYSMSTTGVIYPININTALAGTPLDSLTDGNAPQNANGLGFSSLNGKFYYFERSAATVAPVNPRQQFVSYDPATKIVSTLNNPVISAPAANKIRAGCVNNAGTGYYTIDPSFSGTTAAFYFYNIAGNTWTTLTTSFDSVGGAANSLNTILHNLNSGDMAFDGLGNLWIVASNTTQYSLYKVAAPVPTTAVAKMTAKQIIPPTALPGSTGGKAFTGIAFNTSGALYLSTGSGNNNLYRIMTTTNAPVYLGTFPKDDIGGDLTSCSFPVAVLAVSPWQNFTAVLHNGIDLSWQAAEGDGITGYGIEYSHDGSHWDNHGFVTRTTSAPVAASSYHFVDQQYSTGNNYYRIIQYTVSGVTMISPVRFVNTKATHAVYAGPNPAKDILYVYSSNTTVSYMAQVFDRSGRLVQTAVVPQGQQTINIAGLPKGAYVLRLLATDDNAATSLQFIKW